MRAKLHASKAVGIAFFAIGLAFAAVGVARAQDDLPPGFKADPNDPFKDSNGPHSGPSSPTPPQPSPSPGPGYPGRPPTYPVSPGFSPPGFQPGRAAPLTPPLEDKAEGLPIDSTQSVNATLSYLDHAVQQHMKPVTYSSRDSTTLTVYYEVIYSPGLEQALVPMMAKFGGNNLKDALRLKPDPHANDDLVAQELKSFETKVLQEALQLATAPPPPSAAPAQNSGMPGNGAPTPPAAPTP